MTNDETHNSMVLSNTKALSTLLSPHEMRVLHGVAAAYNLVEAIRSEIVPASHAAM